MASAIARDGIIIFYGDFEYALDEIRGYAIDSQHKILFYIDRVNTSNASVIDIELENFIPEKYLENGNLNPNWSE